MSYESESEQSGIKAYCIKNMEIALQYLKKIPVQDEFEILVDGEEFDL